jgi:hypothetical protein
MWFLLNGIILTKDNIVKVIRILFLQHKKTIQHLFSDDCRLTRFVWRVFEIAFGLRQQTSPTNLFGP